MADYTKDEAGAGGPLNPQAPPKTDASRLRVPSPPSPAFPATGANKGGKGGKEGDTGQPPLPPSNAAFLQSVIRDISDGASAVICSKPGDPTGGGWNAEAARNVDAQCPSSHNNYLNCSTFSADDDGGIHAKKEQFSAFHTLVLDDVGTKVDRALLAGIEPTWEIETSSGNSQVGFRLDPPIRDQAAVKRLQDAVMAAKLCDRGAGGAARWVRLPDAINGKPKHRGEDGLPFRCRLIDWRPDVAYSIGELAELLSLQYGPQPFALVRRDGNGRDASLKELRGDDVFTPRPSENPVVAALKSKGLYKRLISEGKHDVTCPWVNEHSDALDTGAAYFEPSGQFPAGGYRCQHSHGDGISIGKLLTFLDVDLAAAEGKPKIKMVSGAIGRIVRAAEQVLAMSGSFYQANGIILVVRKDARSGAISTEMANEQMLTTVLSDAARWERRDGRSKDWSPSDPPQRVVQMLLKGGEYTFLPVLRGIARQPFFREEDLHLVTEPGYDAVSGIYADFVAADYSFPEPTFDAALYAKQELDHLLREFQFATDTDRATTVSAMLTATVRPTLPLAPAYNITASASGSGKSYLARTIVPFGTPGDALTMGYPPTAEEASKAMLAALLQAPAIIVFVKRRSKGTPDRRRRGTPFSDNMMLVC